MILPSNMELSGRWNLLQFSLACSYTMGLTAMSSFPFLVYQHTGLFLVAYYVLLLAVAVPVALLQLKLGSITANGVSSLFSHFLPAFKGVSLSMLLIAFVHSVLVGVYLSQILFYMAVSLEQPFRWDEPLNATIRVVDQVEDLAGAGPEYFYHEAVLRRSGSVLQLGSVAWYLAASLAASWAVVFVCVFRGSSFFGKVLVVLSPLSWILLFALLAYGHLYIPSAYHSLGQFFTAYKPGPAGFSGPDDQSDRIEDDILKYNLASPFTWCRALEQHVFNLGLWTGILPMIGADMRHEKALSNILWMILVLIHSILPHLLTITIAPFVHALAIQKHMDFEAVISSGHKLFFIVLPEAFSVAKVPGVIPFLFYAMIALFLLHSQALIALAVARNISETFPDAVALIFRRRESLMAAICLMGFLLGLPHLTQGGFYLTRILHLYLYRYFGILIICCIAPFALAYIRVNENKSCCRVCLSCWFVLASLAVSAMLLYHLCAYTDPYLSSLGLSSTESWIGLAIAILPMFVCNNGGFLHAVFTSSSKGCKKIYDVFHPQMGILQPDDPENSDRTLEQRRRWLKAAAEEAAAAASPKPRKSELHLRMKPSSNGKPAQL